MRARDTLTPEIARDLEAMEAAVAGRPATDGDPLLAELAALVAETRPEPDPAWANTLDARQRRGFPLPARRGIAKRVRVQFLAPALGLAACAVVALVIALSQDQVGSTVDDVGSGSAGSSASTVSPAAADSGAERAPAPTA